MAIREKLRLDHFYVDLPREVFRALLPLKDTFAGSLHKVVEVEGASWEGLYIYAANGVYFELLGRGPGSGLALSAEYIQYEDASRIVEEMPWLPWASGERVWPGGKPWFRWDSTTPDVADKTAAFETWTMKYYFNERERGRAFVQSPITRFRRLHLQIGETRYAEIAVACEWLPGRNSIGGASCQLEIPARDGTIFEIEIERVAGSIVALRELEFEVRPDVMLEPRRLGDFELCQRGLRGFLSALTD